MTESEVREWLMRYAWAESTPADKKAVVDCIMAQDGWRAVSAVADQYAGAQFEPGPAAYAEGVEFALSALYECHTAPHLPGCPAGRGQS